MQQLPPALEPFRAYRQFLAFKLVPKANGKSDKFPVNPRTGDVCDAHDVSAWTGFDEAAAFASLCGPAYGVAFVFTSADPFWFLDVDNCLVDGAWTPLASSLCQALAGAAVEISSSGTGLHLFGTGTVPPHGCKNGTYGLEFYTEKRFVALTGTGAQGSAAADLSAVLPWLVSSYFPEKVTHAPAEWTSEPCEGWNGYTDDAELLERALGSRSVASAFGNRASFRDLYEGDVDALAKAYPDNYGARAYDASSADAALASHLAFWTGRDCERMLRIMSSSALRRDKWDREDYLYRTIVGACAGCRDVYNRPAAPEFQVPAPVAGSAPVAQGSAPVAREGDGFLLAGAQLDHFAGCVYVKDMSAVYRDGEFYKPDQFRVKFGGYVYQLDASNEKVSRDAWETFTQSSVIRWPIAEGVCFYPNRPPTEIVDVDGRPCVNIYYPAKVRLMDGDPTPFLRHLATLLPDPRDQAILLAYLAAVVQYPGVKFQWCPFLQGVEGNGKSLFTYVLQYAVGPRYSHLPKADDLANKFNVWIRGKIFIGVEDVYVTGHKLEVWEALKPMITGTRLEVQPKGKDQVTEDVCANWLLNSNHKDAVPKTENDRRVAIFYTAQQSKADIERAGMGGTYFPDLYDWLRADGFAIVARFLMSYQIPDELNPATKCRRAPDTSSTAEAVNVCQGNVEQEIAEAVAQGVPGFAGGWISSMAIDRLFRDTGNDRRVPRSRRRELLQRLGYDYHPALRDGRVDNAIFPDGGKPRLFVKMDSILRNYTTPAEVARAYSEAQGVPAGKSVSVA